MPCFFPLQAYKSDAGTISFSERPGCSVHFALELPCGQCVGCRLERSRQWAMRCLHESSLYERNCFLTLTYSDEFLPFRGQLRYRDFQGFMKRLRKFASTPLRFFMCGEYGTLNMRPHYHALIFGFDFDDKVPFRLLDSGCRIYNSSRLEKLWYFGASSVGAVTFESAAYTARY